MVKSTFTNPIIAIYEESKTVYQRLTKDLLEGQKALFDAALLSAAATTVEVAAGIAINTKAALIVKSTVPGNKIVPSTQKLLSVEKPLIPLIKEELSHSKLLSAAKKDGITGAFIFKTDNKLVSLFNVESKDFGKTIANVNIPNEKICLADLNILKQQFGDTIIQKLEQKQILVPKTHYILDNLPKDASTVQLVKYGKGNLGIKLDNTCTQIHHLIPQQFSKEDIFNFCGIDIKNDVRNKMILYTLKGLELATTRADEVRKTYAKMVKQLNPTLTLEEIKIISELKVPPPSQRSTHLGRHDKNYTDPIQERLNDLWDDVKLGNLNKEECRKKIYDIMYEVREGIKNGRITLNKGK